MADVGMGWKVEFVADSSNVPQSVCGMAPEKAMVWLVECIGRAGGGDG
jgi:hypothetical protein